MSEGMTEATALDLIAAIRENTAATTRAAIANEGVVQVLRESGEEQETEDTQPAPTYMDGTPR